MAGRADLTPREVESVRKSWQSIVLAGDTAINMFYRRLFAIDPEAHALFADTEMAHQRAKFLETFSLFVKNIDDLAALEERLRQLGDRHFASGVEARHYESVRKALRMTLEGGLGQTLDAEASDAWNKAYDRIAGLMRSHGGGQ
jgi:hemoglobin-like flavoprotein